MMSDSKQFQRSGDLLSELREEVPILTINRRAHSAPELRRKVIAECFKVRRSPHLS